MRLFETQFSAASLALWLFTPQVCVEPQLSVQWCGPSAARCAAPWIGRRGSLARRKLHLRERCPLSRHVCPRLRPQGRHVRRVARGDQARGCRPGGDAGEAARGKSPFPCMGTGPRLAPAPPPAAPAARGGPAPCGVRAVRAGLCSRARLGRLQRPGPDSPASHATPAGAACAGEPPDGPQEEGG